ncbi:MAG: hypothetical protein E6G50_14495 [Actinobacteria bacterium]|nr:MAG: hypothetical protein E6G50_14495 [Actinomycetota bacterium]
MTVSPPVRIAAIVGLLAALALGVGFMLMGHGSGSAAPAHVAIKHHPFGSGAKSATPAKPAAKPTTPGKASTPTKPAPVVHTVPARPAAESAALAAGLPAKIAHALGQSRVVVVEFSNPTSEVDAIAFAEAKAGAALGGVPFVPLNVLSQADVGALTDQFGQTLPDPGLFIYTRPAKITFRFDGFVDKETVAQAAHNAAVGLTSVTSG